MDCRPGKWDTPKKVDHTPFCSSFGLRIADCGRLARMATPRITRQRSDVRSRDRFMRAGWRHGLVAGYALFLAFVLPFICWGAWATPGHPHSAPHFVFLSPPAAHVHGLETSPQSGFDRTFCGKFAPELAAALAIPPALRDAATQPDAVDESTAAAQSRPDTSLVIGLLLLVLVAWWLPDGRRLLAARLAPGRGPTPFCAPVPTPPPRLLRCAQGTSWA